MEWGDQEDNERSGQGDNARGDEQRYPNAPLPPHERAWRHPSELGQAAWVRSEPPLSIGRGLLATTGVIGGLLGLAVLWAMLPVNTGSGVTALSTVAGGFGTTGNGQDAFIRETTVPTTAPQDRTSTSLVAPVSTDAPVPPVPTMQVEQQVLTGAPAIAVSIGDGSLVVTTAVAVADNTTVLLSLASGEVAEARVVMVDAESGVAVLSLQLATVTESFDMAPPAHDGDTVTVLGDSPQDLQISVDTDGAIALETWDTPGVVEGTPVVDSDGRLVGLCSHGDDGQHLVLIGAVEDLHSAVEDVAGGQAWLGVQLNNDPTGALTIAAVDPEGPAAAGGLAAGDTIVAVDSVPAADPAELATALARHFPGDLIAVALLHPDGSQQRVTITLGTRPSSL